MEKRSLIRILEGSSLLESWCVYSEHIEEANLYHLIFTFSLRLSLLRLPPTPFLRPDESRTAGTQCIFEQRTFIKDASTKKNIPIQAIGLSLYESLPDTTEEMIGAQIIRTQWLGPSKVLLGRRALIVDEVDDSRQTLQYVPWY